MRSLTARLTISLLLALALLSAGWLGAIRYSLRQLTETFVATRLSHDADNLLTAVEVGPDGRVRLIEARLDRLFLQPYSGHYFAIIQRDVGDQPRVLRSRSLWDSELSVPPADGWPDEGRLYLAGPLDQWLLAQRRRATVGGRALEVIVAEDVTTLEQGLRRLLLGFAITVVLMLILLGAVQAFIVRLGLRPLRRVQADIQRLDRGEIRQLDARAPAEIRPLVSGINHLLSTLEQRLQRSRHALGNLAHALKTPLAVLTQLADRAPGEDGRILREQARTIDGLISRELKRARIAGPAVPGQRRLSGAEIEELLATLRRIYRDKGLTLQTRMAPNPPLPGDRDDLLELLGNLLDNACQWARSVVRLTATGTTTASELTIEDDGPGCPDDQLERLTRRGVRLDEQQQGHGLGLAIVADIVEQYGGALRFDRSPELDGLRVTVHLPFAGPMH